MNGVNLHLAHAIESVSRALSEWIVQQHVEKDPQLMDRYAPDGRRLWRTDVQVRLSHLAQALGVGSPELFLSSIGWSKIAFIAREVELADLRVSLECTAEVLRAELPADVAEPAVRYVGQAIEQLSRMPASVPGHLDDEGPWVDLSRRYLEALLELDRERGARLLLDAHASGASLRDLYLEVIRPAMAEVGRMWQMNELAIADEHACTAATQQVMARLFGAELDRRAPSPNGRCVLITSVGGDLHELGPRMVSEFLELDGWRTVFLGPNTPPSEVVSAVVSNGAELVAVSAGTDLAIQSVLELIDQLRRDPDTSGVKVLVGGRPFVAVNDLWKRVGADGFATDADQAVESARSLVA